ncbi:MAG: site-2 protease family protein [Candidatus Anammoxibacter sp.]
MDLQRILVFAPAILFAITIHEFSHAWTANKLGDSTAKLQGRLTLNPIAHLDLMGTICFIVAHFGWGKPVPVNAANFNNPRRDNMLVSFAGPASNFISAFGLGIIFHFINGRISPTSNLALPIFEFLFLSIRINLFLAFFNLIPLFPLDGSHILKGMLPYNLVPKFESISKYGPFILMGLILLSRPTGISILGAILNPPVIFFSRMFTGI